MRIKIMEGIPAVLAAAGLAILLPGPAWAAGGPQPASGTLQITSETVDSVRVAGGNTIRVVTLGGFLTGTFDGPFTETDREVIHSDGSVNLQGKGVQSGTLGTCGTGSVPYVTEAQGDIFTLSGRFQTIDQAASTSTPLKIHSVDTFTVDNATGLATYSGTYHCS
jgi:hypothetical protein